MKKLIFSLAVILLFTAMHTISTAQPRQKFQKKIFKERMVEKLDLTDLQKEKISDLRTSHQKKMADYKAELEKSKIDMRDIRDNDNLSRNNFISAVEKMNSIKNKMALERANHRMDVYELLTDEQKEIWKDHEPFREHFGMGFKHRGFGKRSNCCELGPPDFDKN